MHVTFEPTCDGGLVSCHEPPFCICSSVTCRYENEPIRCTSFLALNIGASRSVGLLIAVILINTGRSFLVNTQDLKGPLNRIRVDQKRNI